MDIFNAPSRETCTVRRERTNTPLQALVTLNDPQFVEAAKRLAATLVAQSDLDDSGRIDWLSQRLLCRQLETAERTIVLESLEGLRNSYLQDAAAAGQLLGVGQYKLDIPANAHELAAWTMLVNELLNLDEVLNK
jgi:hypothetical protein